jgi:hypothetical protein
MPAFHGGWGSARPRGGPAGSVDGDCCGCNRSPVATMSASSSLTSVTRTNPSPNASSPTPASSPTSFTSRSGSRRTSIDGERCRTRVPRAHASDRPAPRVAAAGSISKSSAGRARSPVPPPSRPLGVPGREEAPTGDERGRLPEQAAPPVGPAGAVDKHCRIARGGNSGRWDPLLGQLYCRQALT